MAARKPKSYVHQTKESIIAALLKTNGLVHPAAKALGCTPQTIYSWRDKDADVKAAIEHARDSIVDEAEKSLRKAVEAGEPWAVALALKTIGKGRGYTERQEITGADGGAVEIALKGYVNVNPDDL